MAVSSFYSLNFILSACFDNVLRAKLIFIAALFYSATLFSGGLTQSRSLISFACY